MKLNRNTPIYIEYTKGAVPNCNKITPQQIDYKGMIKTPTLLAKYLLFNINDFYSENISNASSNEYFVLEGCGKTILGPNDEITWQKGDVFILPFQQEYIIHKPDENSLLFKVSDAPLLAFLNCKPYAPKFLPTFFSNKDILNQIHTFNNEKNSHLRNRNGALLTTDLMVKNNLNTISHTMWSLYNFLAPKSSQPPHKHNSIALDLCIDVDLDASIQGLVYTLMGKEIDKNNNIINPIKMIWKKNLCFSTPPGWWHSHHNESDKAAWVFPIQDAGLHTHMETLNISFKDNT